MKQFEDQEEQETNRDQTKKDLLIIENRQKLQDTLENDSLLENIESIDFSDFKQINKLKEELKNLEINEVIESTTFSYINWFLEHLQNLHAQSRKKEFQYASEKIKELLNSILHSLQNKSKDINSVFSWYKELKKHQVEEIQRNHPLIGMERIQEKSTLIWFLFQNIKPLNDSFWQNTTDKIISKIKETIHQILEDKFPSSYRIIQDDYKNFVINIFHTSTQNNSNNLIQEFVQNNTKEIINKALKSKEIENIIEEIAYKQFLVKKLNSSSNNPTKDKLQKYGITNTKQLEEFLMYNNIPRDRLFFNPEFDSKLFQEKIRCIKEKIRQIDIWIWYTHTPENFEKSTEKLQALRKAQIASKNSIDQPVEYQESNIIESNIYQSRDAEEQIFKLYKKDSFYLNWYSYPVIVVDWKPQEKINPALINAVRKEEEIQCKNCHKLKSLITKYIQGLNNWLDFIFPWWTNIQYDTKKAEEDIILLNKYIEGEELTKKDLDRINKLIKNNSKWTISKSRFFREIEGKKWNTVFVDIKDMWVQNIEDFRETSQRYMETKDQDILLESWLSITQKFANMIKTLREKLETKNQQVEISIWWDEIYIFTEDDETTNLQEIIDLINHTLFENSLDGRISCIQWKVENSHCMLEKLDINTGIPKSVEKTIEIIYHQINSHNKNHTNLQIEKEFLNWILNNITIRNQSNIQAVSEETCIELKEKLLENKNFFKHFLAYWWGFHIITKNGIVFFEKHKNWIITDFKNF